MATAPPGPRLKAAVEALGKKLLAQADAGGARLVAFDQAAKLTAELATDLTPRHLSPEVPCAEAAFNICEGGQACTGFTATAQRRAEFLAELRTSLAAEAKRRASYEKQRAALQGLAKEASTGFAAAQTTGDALAQEAFALVVTWQDLGPGPLKDAGAWWRAVDALKRVEPRALAAIAEYPEARFEEDLAPYFAFVQATFGTLDGDSDIRRIAAAATPWHSNAKPPWQAGLDAFSANRQAWLDGLGAHDKLMTSSVRAASDLRAAAEEAP